MDPAVRAAPEPLCLPPPERLDRPRARLAFVPGSPRDLRDLLAISSRPSPLPLPLSLRQAVRLLSLTELHRHFHPQLKLWEPPAISHVISEGKCVTCCELLLPEDDPLHQQRRTALQRIVAMDAKRPVALLPLNTKLEQTLRKMHDVALKRRWLQALLYRDGANDELEAGVSFSAQSTCTADGAAPEQRPASVKSEEDGGEAATAAAAAAAASTTAAAAAAAGRQLRSLPGFARALLLTNEHAATHSLQSNMLSTPSLPPPLPAEGDLPPPPDRSVRAFNRPWAAYAVRCYLEDGKGAAKTGAKRR